MSTRPAPRRQDVTTLELVGGPEPLSVSLAEHDPRWAETFREHRDRWLYTGITRAAERLTIVV